MELNQARVPLVVFIITLLLTLALLHYCTRNWPTSLEIEKTIEGFSQPKEEEPEAVFEYWFLNVRDVQDDDKAQPWNHSGGTTDFLEFVCEVTRNFDTKVAGEFVSALMEDKTHELDFLRVTGWEFLYQIEGTDQTIKLVRLGANVSE